MQGILLVNKPLQWTSFDVVAKIRGIIAAEEKLKPSQVKVGHCGTLDPLATGLLIIVIGKTYTRLAGDLTKLDKEYLAELTLGGTTASGDLETEVDHYSNHQPSKGEVEHTLKKFTGLQTQMPPNYSALKINGKRAYKLAREGKEVALKARPVTIHKLKLVSYEYPKLTSQSLVSSGTYIRSLAVDIGKVLNTGAYLSALKRTKIADFNLKDSISTYNLSYELIAENLSFI